MIMTQTLCGNFLIYHLHNVKVGIIIPPHIENGGMKGKGEFCPSQRPTDLNPALRKDNVLLGVIIHDFTEVKTVVSPNFLMVK